MLERHLVGWPDRLEVHHPSAFSSRRSSRADFFDAEHSQSCMYQPLPGPRMLHILVGGHRSEFYDSWYSISDVSNTLRKYRSSGAIQEITLAGLSPSRYILLDMVRTPD